MYTSAHTQPLLTCLSLDSWWTLRSWWTWTRRRKGKLGQKIEAGSGGSIVFFGPLLSGGGRASPGFFDLGDMRKGSRDTSDLTNRVGDSAARSTVFIQQAVAKSQGKLRKERKDRAPSFKTPPAWQAWTLVQMMSSGEG